ncbi:MAG: gliding motility protein GldL [Paludibacteraceae bacterium]|nr:gliding motility protein GldL [Paludibacteraceae bacterium]
MAKSEKAEKATEGAKKMGAWAKFMHWYESYQGKRIVGVVYSIGASVVIVGALFKIMHWPGASIVLVSGMITEAFLFVIGALDKPHPEFNWSNVFPQLLEFGTDPAILEKKAAQARPTLLGAGVEGGEIPVIGGNAAVNSIGVQTPTAVSAAHVPALSDKELESLQNGIADLAKTATQLSELGKVAIATTQLTTKMEAAGTAAEQFAASQNGLLSVSNQLSEAYKAAETHMQGAADTTKMFAANMQNVGAQLSTLNSIYELQINALKEQVEISKAQNSTLGEVSDHLQVMKAHATEAEKSQEAYAAGSKKLAAQVADLNAIYGNMLNALA